MMYYVNVGRAQADEAWIPLGLPRHRAVGVAHDAQVEEGWPWTGAAVIVFVDEEGFNYGHVS